MLDNIGILVWAQAKGTEGPLNWSSSVGHSLAGNSLGYQILKSLTLQFLLAGPVRKVASITDHPTVCVR